MRRILGIQASIIGLVCPIAGNAQAPWQPAAVARQNAPTTLLDRNAHRVRFQTGEGVVAITLWGERTARVTANREATDAPAPGLAVIGSPAQVQ